MTRFMAGLLATIGNGRPAAPVRVPSHLSVCPARASSPAGDPGCLPPRGSLLVRRRAHLYGHHTLHTVAHGADGDAGGHSGGRRLPGGVRLHCGAGLRFIFSLNTCAHAHMQAHTMHCISSCTGAPTRTLGMHAHPYNRIWLHCIILRVHVKHVLPLACCPLHVTALLTWLCA